jgi:hypothetical protein
MFFAVHSKKMIAGVYLCRVRESMGKEATLDSLFSFCPHPGITSQLPSLSSTLNFLLPQSHIVLV